MYVINFGYCEITINCGVLIFADFVADLNHESKKPTKYNIPHWLLPEMFKITNSRIHWSMHFVETTKIGANE